MDKKRRKIRDIVVSDIVVRDIIAMMDIVAMDIVAMEIVAMDIVAMDIMIYDSTGSLQGSTGWYLMLLGQYGAILVVTCWYWVSITWY